MYYQLVFPVCSLSVTSEKLSNLSLTSFQTKHKTRWRERYYAQKITLFKICVILFLLLSSSHPGDYLSSNKETNNTDGNQGWIVYNSNLSLYIEYGSLHPVLFRRDMVPSKIFAAINSPLLPNINILHFLRCWQEELVKQSRVLSWWSLPFFSWP